MYFPELIQRAWAAGINSSGGTTVSIKNPLCGGSPDCTIVSILEKISLYLLTLGAPVAAIMIIYGAFQILTAGGDPAKAKNGGKTILFAAIGYGVILISWGVISLVKQLISS